MSNAYSHIKMFLTFRPIVQLVERAAHDGFVVGSNPTGPIQLLLWTLILKLIKL